MMLTRVSNVICYSLRQLFANAAIAASRVAAYPCVGVRSSYRAKGERPKPWLAYRRGAHIGDACPSFKFVVERSVATVIGHDAEAPREIRSARL
jgi:hypothetical protein